MSERFQAVLVRTIDSDTIPRERARNFFCAHFRSQQVEPRPSAIAPAMPHQ